MRDIVDANIAVISHLSFSLRRVDLSFQKWYLPNGEMMLALFPSMTEIEMDGVSLSNARQAARLAAHKLRSSTKFVQWS